MRISDWSSDVCSSDLMPGVTGDMGRCDQGPQTRRFPCSRHHRHRACCGNDVGGLAGRTTLCWSDRCGRCADFTRMVWPDPVEVRHLSGCAGNPRLCVRSAEHTSELQSLMRISYAVFCLKKKK